MFGNLIQVQVKKKENSKVEQHFGTYRINTCRIGCRRIVVIVHRTVYNARIQRLIFFALNVLFDSHWK